MDAARRALFLCLAFWLGSGSGLLSAQDHGSIVGTPFSTAADEKTGADSFRSQCAACHGLLGEGGSNGPRLTTGTFRHGGSDESLFRTISKGVPGTAMVSFPLNGKEIWQLIAFLRSVNRGVAAEQVKGNAAEGERVYRANGCAACHTIAGEGGLSGPDLTGIAARSTLEQIKASLLDPDADVSPDFWSLRAKTKTAQTVTGIRMNEDMDTFQIREPSGKLRSLRKADLASYEIVHVSPMPSWKGKLSADEMQNLIAYLSSSSHQPEVK